MNKKLKTDRIECLEDRLLMTVEASLSSDGDLVVQGDANGAVEISVVESGGFQVSDNGVVVATIDGVDDDMRIRITGEGDDRVTLNLGAQVVDKVFAALGAGINAFAISGGTIERELAYRGGSGNDILNIDSTVAGRLFARLGSGDNGLTLAGTLGSVHVDGGGGMDTVSLEEGGIVEGSFRASLGNGDNSLSIEGMIEEDLKYGGGAGDDTVNLVAGATVDGDTHVRLGGGENRLNHAGQTSGDLKIVSATESDSERFEVADGSVLGDTTLGAGEQYGRGSCGRGGFRGFRRNFRGF
jgi:hypothetical protein